MSGGASVNRLAVGAIALSLLVIAAVAVLYLTRGTTPAASGNEAEPAAVATNGASGSITIATSNAPQAAPEEETPPPVVPEREDPRKATTPTQPRPVPPREPGAADPSGPVTPPVVTPPAAPTVARPPRLTSGAITARDYPSAAELSGVGGTTSARLTIGPNGRVTNCTVTASSGSRVLDRTTCNLAMRRYRYAPALDTTGRPTSATIPLRVTWTP